MACGNLGRLLSEGGQPKEAETLLRSSLEHLDPEIGGQRRQWIASRRALGQALIAPGRAQEALPILEQALQKSREEFGESDWRTAYAQLTYGNALVASQRVAEARPFLNTANEILQRHRKEQPQLSAQAAAALTRLH